MWKSTLPLFDETLAHWQRRDVLVAVLHAPGCAACAAVADALRRVEAAWRQDEVGIVTLPLTPENEAHAKALFRSLAPFDVPEGAPTLAIADRFGRVFAALDAHAEKPDALLDDAHGWIAYVQSRCEECGPPLDWGPA